VERAWDDEQYEDETLTDVTDGGDYWSLSMGGMGIAAPKRPGHTPQIGERVRLWGKGFGYPVRGIAVGDVVLRYETEREMRERFDREAAQREREQRAAYEAAREQTEARVAALPEVLRRRIARFRANNPDFGWKYEGYELFVCEQAVVIADALKAPGAIQAWRDLPWEAQVAAVPGLDDGHSGNTFGAACVLAHWYLTQPENVVHQHGALSPLVGSDEYGDGPAGETDE
jgi:hypothetical protein